MAANSTKSETSFKLGTQPYIKSHTVVKAAKETCGFTTADKKRCGENCTERPISTFPGVDVILYTCVPRERAEPSVFVTVTPVSTIVIFLGPSTTRTQPLPTNSGKEVMSKGACGDVVREFSACPINCPASVIPGGVGAVYSCVDPTATSKNSSSSTPATVDATTTPASSATATSNSSSTTPATPPSSTFETSVSPTASQDASTSSTPPSMQTFRSFEQTPAGKATIAVSLVSGLLFIGLALFFYRRHKRKAAARNRQEPETIQLRCDVANRKSDSKFSDEDSRALSIWEVLTNTTREEFHAQRGAELREAERRRSARAERAEKYREQARQAQRTSPEAFPF